MKNDDCQGPSPPVGCSEGVCSTVPRTIHRPGSGTGNVTQPPSSLTCQPRSGVPSCCSSMACPTSGWPSRSTWKRTRSPACGQSVASSRRSSPCAKADPAGGFRISGIVLHVAGNYLKIPTHIPWVDDRPTKLADLLVSAIHVFRMPVFFVIAGFLAAMLLERRGRWGFLRHRLLRLALPFALFWPVLWLLTGLAGLLFLNRIKLGQWGLDRSVVPAHLGNEPNTLHLWFLLMLFFFCVATSLLSLLPARLWAAPARALAWLGSRWWGFALLAVPLYLANHSYPTGLVLPSGKFFPVWNEWLNNGVFFVFGLVLWAHRATLMPIFERHWRRYAAAALLLFLVAGGAYEAGRVPLFSALYLACTWLATLAWIGFGLQMLGRSSARMAYLADSAYWVYLVHFPLTVLFGALLYGAPLWPGVKMLLGIVGTTVLCLASYQLWVRHTWVSVLLNGKRHPRREPTPA